MIRQVDAVGKLGMSGEMITILSGTSRRGSNSLKVARTVLELYQELGREATLLDLQELPEEAMAPGAFEEKPESLTRNFTDKVLASAGLVVVVPEYNGSFPGVLKHFIDLLPFPASFDCRPVAFVGLSAGYHGALRPVEQMQMVFAYRNAYLYNRRVFIPSVHKVLGPDGRVADEEVKRRLAEQARGFSAFVEALAGLRD